MSQAKSMIKLLGTSRIKSPARVMRDSDKDGVPNIFDCQPYNKNKQGIIDDIKNKFHSVKQNIQSRGRIKRDARELVRSGEIRSERDVQEKTGSSLARETAMREYREKEVRDARADSRHKERIRQARVKGRASARPGSGFMGGFSRGITHTDRRDRARLPTYGRSNTGKKGKKGKKDTRPRRITSLSDIDFSGLNKPIFK